MSCQAIKATDFYFMPFTFYGDVGLFRKTTYDPDESSAQSQYPVRPVKGEVKENSYERPVSVTPGDCIDLGLSVKWAACNAGASSPEEEGTTFYLSSGNYGGYDTGRWRMPTVAEANELLESCTWEWGIYNGVNGYQVTGPNGNSIFLPAYFVDNHVGIYHVGIRAGRVDILGISSQNHVLTDYSTRNAASSIYSAYTYCVRPVALE